MVTTLSSSVCPTAGASSCRGRSTASTAPVTARSWSPTTRPGGKAKFKDLSPDDPTAGGTLFQLPSYAAAARARFGTDDTIVHAEYGLMGKGKYERPGYVITPEVDERVRSALAARRGRHRNGLLPEPARAARIPLLHLVRVLRTRPSRHGRAMGRVGPQTARSSPRALVRPDRRRHVSGADASDSPASPPDRRHRPMRHRAIRIRTDLDTTLFVEAGAGAGKTSSLVARIVSLVRAGVPITGDRRHHVHREGRRRVAQPHPPQPRARSEPREPRAALDRLDHAPIGTLHSFARRMLFDFPIEAGLPPGFAVLDELESGLAFEEQWDDLLDRLLDEPDPPGGMIDGGRGVRRTLRVRRLRHQQGCPPHGRRLPGQLGSGRRPRRPGRPRAAASRHRRAARASAPRSRSTPVPPDDTQAETTRDIAALVDELAAADSAANPARVDRRTRSPFRALGDGKRWPGAKAQVDEGLRRRRRVRPRSAAAASRSNSAGSARRLLEGVRRHRGSCSARSSAASSSMRADERTDGRSARVPRPARARPAPADRPAARPPRSSTSATSGCSSTSSRTPTRSSSSSPCGSPPPRRSRRRPRPTVPWHRRGDGSDRCPAGCSSSATRSSRSTASAAPTSPCTCAPPTRSAPTASRSRPTSARPRPSSTSPTTSSVGSSRSRPTPSRRTNRSTPVARGRRSVTARCRVLGADRHDDLTPNSRNGELGAADALRRREAADVAATVVDRARRRVAGPRRGADALRPCRPGDICILLPTRTSLPALEAALAPRATSPYRAENSSVVYATAEIRHLLLVLRAADDPTDELALVEALRTPLYGCSDVELWEWKRAGRPWNPWAPPPDGLRRRTRSPPPSPTCARSPSASAGRRRPICSRRSSTSAGCSISRSPGPTPATSGGGCASSIEQARAWADAGGHGVRRYLQWAALQASESRVADTILPENDHDAVRVMTIHAAKGLEFPITIVAGLTTKSAPGHDQRRRLGERHVDARRPGRRRRVRRASADRRADGRRRAAAPALRGVHPGVRPPRRVAAPGRADQGQRALRRLGPADVGRVAVRGRSARSERRCAGDCVRAACLRAVAARPPSISHGATRRRGPPSATRVLRRVRHDVPASPPPDCRRSWRQSATATPSTTPGSTSDRSTSRLPPWQRGRYGTSIGRAVHGVLQFCDLATGSDIDNLARSQCAAEGVIGLEDRVASLARSTLDSSHRAPGRRRCRTLA